MQVPLVFHLETLIDSPASTKIQAISMGEKAMKSIIPLLDYTKYTLS
jgi:hypothetical protein